MKVNFNKLFVYFSMLITIFETKFKYFSTIFFHMTNWWKKYYHKLNSCFDINY